MNVNTSNDLTATAMSLYQAQSIPPALPGTGEAGPSSRVAPLESLGKTLSDEAKDALFAGADELDKAGAGAEDIKSFVDSELEANGIDLSNGSQRSGLLLDIMV